MPDMKCMNIMNLEREERRGLTFGFEGKVAVLANIWTDVCVRSDVLLQHAGLLTADATLSTFVLSPAPTSHVDVLFVRLKPKGEG